MQCIQCMPFIKLRTYFAALFKFPLRAGCFQKKKEKFNHTKCHLKFIVTTKNIFRFLCVAQYFVVVLDSVWKSHLLLRSHYLSTHWRGHHLSSYTSSPPNPVKIFSIRWQPQSLSLCSINSSWHHSPKGWTCICKYLVLLVKRLLLTLGMCVARNAIFFKANLVHK